MNTILIVLAVGLVAGIIIAITNSKKRKKSIAKLGLEPNQLIFTGKYTSGHPDLDKPLEATEMAAIDNDLNIYFTNKDAILSYIAKIPIDQIENITIEDASTIERRVTAGRLLVTGIFAFAIKKKKKDEMSYLIIEWNDGKFKHETIFEFVNNGAIEKSNEARNFLIRKIR